MSKKFIRENKFPRKLIPLSHMNNFCSLRVTVMKPKRTVRSSTLKAALKNFLVPCVSNNYRVCSLRSLWEVNEEDNQIAELNIWAKRRQIEDILNGFEDVVMYFSCLTAMESAEMRRKLKARKRRINSDNKISTDLKNKNLLIPGKIDFYSREK